MINNNDRTKCQTFWNARVAKLNHQFLSEYHRLNGGKMLGKDIAYLKSMYCNLEWARKRRNDLTKNHGEW